MRQEPPKAAVLAWEKGVGAPPARVAFCIIQVPDIHAIFEAEILLSEQPANVVGWRERRGVQPLVTIEDCIEASPAMRCMLDCVIVMHINSLAVRSVFICSGVMHNRSRS